MASPNISSSPATTMLRGGITMFSRIALVALCVFVLFKLGYTSGPQALDYGVLKEQAALAAQAPIKVEEHKIPLEAHIMSKCPDARDCLVQLLLPTMANISSKVSFQLSYIGDVTDEDDGVECMHGPTECLGNMLELCAADVYPDPKIYLGFTTCLSQRYKEIPAKELIEDCALEHGVDFEKLNDCASRDDGAYATGLLRESVLRSEDLNVTKSCTVRLDGEFRCIRDAHEWKDCPGGPGVDDLIRDIDALYAKANPTAN